MVAVAVLTFALVTVTDMASEIVRLAVALYWAWTFIDAPAAIVYVTTAELVEAFVFVIIVVAVLPAGQAPVVKFQRAEVLTEILQYFKRTV